MFFFDKFYQDLSADQQNHYFFNVDTVTTDDKIRAINEKIWKRAGYKSIYTRLLTLGCFTGLENTPLRSVRNADFCEAIRILSLKNIGL